jgi:hypothetical protein
LWPEGPAKAKGKAKGKGKGKGKDKQKNQEEEEDEEDDEEGEGEREDEQGSQADTSAPALWGPFPQLLREHARVAWVGEAGAEEEEGEGEDSVFRVRALASSAAPTTTLPEPIVPLFSHQRHSMHVHITDVSLEVLNVDEAGRLDRIRWMSALEIRAAGITTGCKKVLDAVCVPSSPSATSKKRAGAATKQKEKKTKQEGGTGSITSFFKPS